MSSLTRFFSQCGNRSAVVTTLRGFDLARPLSKDSTDKSGALEGDAIYDEIDEEFKNAEPFEKMPRVPFIPIFGSAWAYMPYVGPFGGMKIPDIDVLKNKLYGRVVRERFGNLDMVTTYDPAMMLRLGLFEGSYPERTEFITLKAYRDLRKEWFQPPGMLLLNGKEWREFRSKVERNLGNMQVGSDNWGRMHNVAKEFISFIRSAVDEDREIDIFPDLLKWAFEAISRIALDTRIGCLDPDLPSDSAGMKTVNAVQIMLKCIDDLEPSSLNYPFWKHFSTPTWKKFVESSDEFTLLASSYIKDALARYQEAKDKEPNSLLHRLLMKEQLNQTAAMVAVSDIMMAGIDTTASAASFLLYNLAKNPEKQQKAYEEVMTLFPTESDVVSGKKEQIQYIHYCLRESMRLMPTVRGNLRVFNQETVICGYRVPAGTPVLCALHVPYRSKEYFRNPLEFIPERMDRKAADFRRTIGHRSFTPFGAGQRSCIGQTIARHEIYSLVIEVLRNFTLEYHHEDVGIDTKLISIPDRPVRIKFLERKAKET